jgi:peptide/nickel transport system substrate-binding protein
MSDSPFQQEYADHLLTQAKQGKMSRRQLLVRASVLGLSATVVGRLLAACGEDEATTTASPTAQPKAGGTIRVGMPPPIVAVDPTTMYDTGSIAVVQLVCEYLAWVENDLTLRPVLAESWEADAEAKVWTFKLRQGATFHDGKPFGADDVVSTFGILLDPDTISAALASFQGILAEGAVEKVDDATVRFTLEQPFADFPYLVAQPNYDCLMLPAGYKGGWEKDPVGTGPFQMVDYTAKQNATFKKNASYWQSGRPYVDEVKVVFNDEDQALALALQGGEIDMMLVTPVQGSQQLFADATLKVLTTPSTTHREWHLRVDAEPHKDKRVRQALAWTIDRPALVAALFEGKAEVGNDHIFSPLYPLAPTDLPQRDKDIAKAKSLLSEAGYADGVEMTVTVEQYQEIPQYATAVQAMAKEAGIDLKLDVVTVDEYYGSGDNQPWLEVPQGITDWTFRGIPAQYFLPAFTSDGVWNSSHFANADFDQQGTIYNTELDESKRRAAAKRMAEIMIDETPALITYWISVNRAMRKEVEGVTADPGEFLDLSNAWLNV